MNKSCPTYESEMEEVAGKNMSKLTGLFAQEVYICTHAHAHTHSLSLFLSLTHTQAHTHTHTHKLEQALRFVHAKGLCMHLNTHTHAYKHTYTLAHKLSKLSGLLA